MSRSVTEVTEEAAIPTMGEVVTNLTIRDSRGLFDFGRTVLSPINLNQLNSNIDWVVNPSAAAVSTTLETNRIELIRGDC